MHGIDCQSFLALLEYFYTDHCTSLERIPVENVLILADQFCLARLVQICESHIHKDLQQILTEACLPDSKEIMDALAFSRVSNLTFFTNTVTTLLWMVHPSNMEIYILVQFITMWEKQLGDLRRGDWNTERKLGV